MRDLLKTALMVLACGLSPKDKAYSILKDGLGDKSEKIQVAAAGALAHLNDRQGYDKLIKFLTSDNDEIVALATTRFSVIHDTMNARFIRPLLNHKSPLIRRLAIEAMTEIGAREPKIIQMLNEKSVPIIVASCQYIGRMELNKAKRKLIVLARRREPEVRLAAKIALGMLHDRRAKDLIKEEMTKNDPVIWENAIKGLGQIQDTSSIQFLQEIINENIWPLDICAVEALMRLGVRKDEFLISALTHNDPMIRIRAISVISELGDKNLLHYVIPLTEDAYLNIALQSIEFVSHFKTAEVENKLASLLDAKNPYVRIAAAEGYLLLTK